MENPEIAKIFYEIADMLEIKGDNPFRVRSYRNAAQIIESLSESLSDMVAEGERDLREIPGIGESIAQKIIEIVNTGKCSEHQRLLSTIPTSLLDMLQIQGVGPKKVNLFYQKLGIQTVDELEKAASEHKLCKLPGMGEKSEEKILRGIQEYRQRIGRATIAEVAPVADSLKAYLKMGRGVNQVEVAGSFRRGRETIGDLDMLVTCSDAEAALDHLTKFSSIKEVLAKGDTKATVLLKSGLQVDVRVVEDKSFGAALQYFTGSKAHNIAIRDRALKMGLKVNEYGVFKVKTGRMIAGRTEEEVYRAVGLPYIEPELRENRGEIEAAEEGRLPKIIQLEDIKGDLHTHTRETDGLNTILEMAAEAKRHGLKYIAITDHSKSTRVANGMDEKRLLRHIKEIEKANEQIDGIRILKGVECDILADGRLDIDDEVLAQLDVVLVSVHSHFNMSKEEMTDRVIRAFENPHVHIFAHPTGRILKQREPYQIDMERIMDAAKRYKVALELDSYPTRLDLNDIYCKMAKEKGVKVTIDSDAHMTAHFHHLRWGVIQARRGWLEKGDVLNALPVDKFLKSLRNWK